MKHRLFICLLLSLAWSSGSFAGFQTLGKGVSSAMPAAEILAPSSGTTFSAPASFSINAYAADSDGWIDKVELYVGTSLMGVSTEAPYTFYWSNVPEGNYSVTVKATDNDGNVSVSSPVLLIVQRQDVPNQPPNTYLTEPLENTVYTAPASIVLTADASDSDGKIVRVDFYNGSTLIGTDYAAPYTYQWNNVPAGTYHFTSKAWDDKGASRISPAVLVSVKPPLVLDPCQGVPAYTEGGNYVAGSKVTNNARRYECKPWPYSLWCNGASWAYAPGTGVYWTDAWQEGPLCKSSLDQALPDTARAKLSLFPNPVVSALQINWQMETEGYCEMALYKPTGNMARLLLHRSIPAGNQTLEVSLEDLPIGVYYLHYTMGSLSGKLRINKAE